MKFHGIEMVGQYTAEVLTTTPASGSISNKARVIYVEDDELLLVGDNSGNFSVSNMGGMPSGTIMLFEADTSVVGWTLLTTVDDETVYITKGSVAGGEVGGSVKAGSTWTQTGHTHTTGNLALSIAQMPAHTHGISADDCSGGGGDREAGPGFGAISTSTGGGAVHNHGATGSGGTANTWRPLGRNYTRQQKN